LVLKTARKGGPFSSLANTNEGARNRINSSSTKRNVGGRKMKLTEDPKAFSFSFSRRVNLMLGIPLIIVACSSARSDNHTQTIEPPVTPKGPPSPQPEFGALVSQQDPPPPISGGTLAVDRAQGLAVAADPDRDRVYVVDLASRSVRHSIA